LGNTALQTQFDLSQCFIEVVEIVSARLAADPRNDKQLPIGRVGASSVTGMSFHVRSDQPARA
jgi:hypothetical protein